MPRIYDPPVIRTAFLIALRLPVYAPDFAAEGIDQGLRLIACDIDVVGCDAGLAIVGELPSDNLARCIVDIGCRIDDRWGFAAEFECHRGQVLCGCRHHDLADLWATGAENVVERQVEQCLRDRGLALADGNPIRREGCLHELQDEIGRAPGRARVCPYYKI